MCKDGSHDYVIKFQVLNLNYVYVKEWEYGSTKEYDDAETEFYTIKWEHY